MMKELWVRLESWGAQNAPAMLEDLNKGASNEQIADLQKSLSKELPQSFIESLKIHNGENDGWPCKVFANMGAYLDSGAILEKWKQLQMIAEQLDFEDDRNIEEEIEEGIIDVDGPVNPVMFSKDWVPIMDCNGDVFWAIDFIPKEGGAVGQIIEVDWEGTSWKVIATSFDEFLRNYVTKLESGVFKIVDGLPSQYDDA